MYARAATETSQAYTFSKRDVAISLGKIALVAISAVAFATAAYFLGFQGSFLWQAEQYRLSVTFFLSAIASGGISASTIVIAPFANMHKNTDSNGLDIAKFFGTVGGIALLATFVMGMVFLNNALLSLPIWGRLLVRLTIIAILIAVALAARYIFSKL